MWKDSWLAKIIDCVQETKVQTLIPTTIYTNHMLIIYKFHKKSTPKLLNVVCAIWLSSLEISRGNLGFSCCGSSWKDKFSLHTLTSFKTCFAKTLLLTRVQLVEISGFFFVVSKLLLKFSKIGLICQTLH